MPVVERNFDTLSKKFDLTDDEYGSIIKNNPTLTTWLGDRTNAAVSRTISRRCSGSRTR